MNLVLSASILAGCSGTEPAPPRGVAGGSASSGSASVAGAASGGAGGTSTDAGDASAGSASELAGMGTTETAGAPSAGAGGRGGGAANGGSAGSVTTSDGGVAGGGGAAGGASGRDRKATMVVRGQGTATAGDEIMIARIKAHGFAEVVVVSDAAVTAQSVVGSDLVVISSSAESGPLQAKLKDIPIPVLCVEDAEFTKMGMASAGDHTAGITQVVIVGGPLVGTASGTLTISSKPGDLGWATPAASAIRGASLPGDGDKLVVFGYEKGAQMTSLAAPARRAGFAIREQLAANLNADGIELFDSILQWVSQ
ncbi:MAG: hypothetical protein ABUL60_02980 [Myxococcales bacterium]